jgi:hypothetical protein
MRHVQADDINARADQSAQHSDAVTRRADRCDYLGSSHPGPTSH